MGVSVDGAIGGVELVGANDEGAGVGGKDGERVIGPRCDGLCEAVVAVVTVGLAVGCSDGIADGANKELAVEEQAIVV